MFDGQATWTLRVFNVTLRECDREEIARIVDEKIRKALLSGGLISQSMERLGYVGKDIGAVKNDIKKVRRFG